MLASRWVKILLVLGTAKLALGAPGAWIYPASDTHAVPAFVFLIIAIVFGGSGVSLCYMGRRDRRAIHLGLLFLAIGTSYSDRLLSNIGSVAALSDLNLSSTLPLLLAHVQLDAFIPYLTWSFAEQFPRVAVYGKAGRITVVARRVSLVIAGILLAANVYVFAQRDLGIASFLPGVIGPMSRDADGGIYYPLLLLLALPALGFIIWKARLARVEERRRIRILLAGLVLGFAPLAGVVLLDYLWPPFRAFASRPSGVIISALVAYPFLLSIPAVTAYAVLVDRALEVRLVIRQAVRYALARYTLSIVAAVPFIVVLAVLFLGRQQSLTALVTGGQLLMLVGAGTAGLVGLRLRSRVLIEIDRRFFREQYDCQRIIRTLLLQIKGTGDVESLAQLVAREVDKAMHVEKVGFFQQHAGGGWLVEATNNAPPIELDSNIARLCQQVRRALDVEWHRPVAFLRFLPPHEQRWLAEGGFRLLIPIAGPEESLLGLLAVGEKRSELPFSREDRQLLEAIADSSADMLRGIEEARGAQEDEPRSDQPGRSPRATGEDPNVPEDFATECHRCGDLAAPSSLDCCQKCGGELETAVLPLRLGGKYHLVRRIGRGGMGVVYQGVDLSLRRHVALKTLPRMSPEAVVRLRREARAMASVSHANLALLFALEFWGGVPILVGEFLSGGSLKERLGAGRLDVGTALRLGISLSEGVRCLHREGILHRDIKPANIAFDRADTPKLLDFGLARGTGGSALVEDTSVTRLVEEATFRSDWGDEVGSGPLSAALVGTVPYLCPEALDGRAPQPSFDLWSLAMVLYESVAGVNPFSGRPTPLVIAAIALREVPDIREYRPDVRPEIATFFEEALASEVSRRPRSAADFRRRLEAVSMAVR